MSRARILSQAVTADGVTPNLDDDLDAIAALSGTQGFLKKNGANTWLLDGTSYESSANKGVAGGYASLDGSGKVPSTQLPSYVDDVIEAANLAAFPATGEAGKIYVTLDTNKTYRWSGSAYVEIASSPGSTDAVTEGLTNLYFTTARARQALSASGSISYNSTTGVISYTAPTALSAFTNDTGFITASASITGNAATATTATNVSGGTVSATTGNFTGNISLTSNLAIALKDYGYSSNYKAIQIGAPGSTVGSVALGVDVSTIVGSGFSGQNQVIIPANGLIFPNAAGTNFLGAIARDSSNRLLIGPSVSAGITAGDIVIDGTNVGIGTNSPGSRLDVRGVITGGNGTIQTVVSYLADAGVTGTLTNHPYVFYANNAERLRITTDGIFQFPDTNALKIRFNGSVANFYGISKLAGGGTLGDGEYRFTAGNTAAGSFTFSSGSLERMRLDASGNLAIAEGNAPTQVLSLYRSGSTNALMSAGNSNTGLNGTWFGVDTAGNGIVNVRGVFPLLFSTNSLERVRIDASGNVGIGTANPLRKLDIAGGGMAFTESGGAVRNIHWGDTTNIYPVTIAGVASAGNCYLAFNTASFGNAAIERFRVGPDGQLGIGGANYGTSGQVLTSNGSGAAPSWQSAGGGTPSLNIVSATSVTAVASNHYVLTNAAATTVTLPASPAAGAIVWVTAANGRIDNVIARNGQNINSVAENMTIDSAYAGIQLRYADATRGWIFT